MVTHLRTGAVALLIALAATPQATAQSDFTVTVQFGTPATLQLETRYSDPVALFPTLRGTLVFPLWIDVRNISRQPQAFDVQSLQLTLGSTGRAPVVLAPMNPAEAQKRLANDVRLHPGLKAILGQPGPWNRNPYSADLRSGQIGPDKARVGFVFFLKPANFEFNGYMAIGTKNRPPELLTTGLISTTPAITRSDKPTLPDSIYSMMTRLPGGDTLRDTVFGRPFEKSYALLFGISTYEDASYNLTGPASDLRRMQTFLQRQGFDQVVTVSDRAVTESALRNVQMHFAARIQPEDRLLVYYAGHGMRSDSGAAYMLLSRGSRVSMMDFMSWIRTVRVKHLLVLLDACYSGSVIGGFTRDVFKDIDRPTFDKFFRLTSYGSRFVITAGAATELANEHPRWEGGLFTTAMLRALQAKGDKAGLVTTHQMFANMKDFMLEEVRKYHLTSQTPLIQDLGYGGDAKTPPAVSQGEFVFVSGR